MFKRMKDKGKQMDSVKVFMGTNFFIEKIKNYCKEYKLDVDSKIKLE